MATTNVNKDDKRPSFVLLLDDGNPSFARSNASVIYAIDSMAKTLNDFTTNDEWINAADWIRTSLALYGRQLVDGMAINPELDDAIVDLLRERVQDVIDEVERRQKDGVRAVQ